MLTCLPAAAGIFSSAIFSNCSTRRTSHAKPDVGLGVRLLCALRIQGYSSLENSSSNGACVALAVQVSLGYIKSSSKAFVPPESNQTTTNKGCLSGLSCWMGEAFSMKYNIPEVAALRTRTLVSEARHPGNLPSEGC